MTPEPVTWRGYTENMKNILLLAMLVSTPAVAQEFAFDAEAMGKILAGTRTLKVKHEGRPMPPAVSDYEARHISFRLRRNGGGRDDGGVYINKAIEILYRDSHLATLSVNDDPRGWPAAKRVFKAFESLRRDALAQKRRIVINYDAIHRQNKAGAWNSRDISRERELFDEVIRLGIPPAGR